MNSETIRPAPRLSAAYRGRVAGQADLVGLARAALAGPDGFRKMRPGRGMTRGRGVI